MPALCPACGVPLPPDAPGGLCAHCLLQGTPAGRSQTPPGGAFALPAFTELAPLFPQLEILELLGVGGMGAVYKARQIKLDRWVALKIIRPEAAADPAFAERFNREAQTLARLNHSQIVAIHDFGETQLPAASGSTQPLFYFLMEYVEGANLREVMQSGPLPPQEALAIIPQICAALQYAHEQGVVHRDIKPENILLDQRGRVKIADFGLAKLGGGSGVQMTLTGTYQVMGTPRYMAPEQMEGSHSVDHRADIYSLGVVFYEMLTGQVPLGVYEPPSNKAGVDVRVDGIVLKALSRDPDTRFQKASDLQLSVEQLSEYSSASPRGQSASLLGNVSTLIHREVAQARHWFLAGEETAESAKLRYPGTFLALMFLVASSLVVFPYMDVHITEPDVVRNLTATEVIDGRPSYVLRYCGNGLSSAIAAAVLLAMTAAAHFMTPTRQAPSTLWTGLLCLLSLISLVPLLSVSVEVASQYITLEVSTDESSTETASSTRPLYKWDHVLVPRFPYYMAVGLALTGTALTALGIRRSLSAVRVPRSAVALPAAHSGPRFSRAAIGSISLFFVACLGLVLALGTVLTSGNRFGSGDTQAMLMTDLVATAAVGLFASLLGWMTLTRIHHSQGKLLGTGLAFVGAIGFPLVLLDALAIGFPAYALNMYEAPTGTAQSTLLFVTLAATLPISAVIDTPLIYVLWWHVSRRSRSNNSLN